VSIRHYCKMKNGFSKKHKLIITFKRSDEGQQVGDLRLHDVVIMFGNAYHAFCNASKRNAVYLLTFVVLIVDAIGWNL
jgi:hypothetical protein